MGLSGVVAMATAVVSAVVCAAPVRAGAGGADNSYFVLFAGTDMWRDGAFLHGGLLWSPAGLDVDGFTLKLIMSGGGYTYPSSGLQADFGGTMLSAAALPGWRFTRNGITVGLYAGPLVQDYRLTPDDPGSRLRGLYAGAQVAGDVWYQPSARTMVSLNGSIASVGPSGSLRGAFGFRLFEPLFVGPETEGIWCADYEQVRFGAHLTGMGTGMLQWSVAGGLASDSDRRTGPYVRLEFSARY
jgi:hypothetical protein